MNKSKILALAALLVTVGGSAAYAQGPGATNDTTDWRARFQEACGTDMQQFCPNLTPGEGKLRDCMNEHQNDLSAKCRDFRAEARAHWHAAREKFDKACKEDVQKFCADVKPGEGRLGTCLKTHENALSPACKDETQAMLQRRNRRLPAGK